jgi:hypothetical protein
MPEDQVEEDIGYDHNSSSESDMRHPEVNPFAQHRRERGHALARREDGWRHCFKVNLPKFLGGLSTKNFVDWLD